MSKVRLRYDFVRMAVAWCAWAALATSTASGQPSCTGDCNGDGSVDVAEVIGAVQIALGAALDTCASIDADGDRRATVDEITSAAGNLLFGCPDAGVVDEFDGFQPGDVAFLASDELDGRDNLSPESAAARAYLIDQLRDIAVGLTPGATGDAAFEQEFDQGTNVLAMIPGGDLVDEYVIVGAHYDHFNGCGAICNGATDNVAGVAAALAIAREIADNPRPLRRSVVFAFWDAEEDGLLGSAYYLRHPLVPLAKTVAYVNYDIQGANLLPSLRNLSFAVAAETGGPRMFELLSEATAGSDLDVYALSFLFGQGRSDYFNFVNGRVPTVFFSDSTGPCYHTSRDDVSVVDFGKLANQAEIGTRLVERLAHTPVLPSYVRTSVSYRDAETVLEVITRALGDLDRFPAEDQTFVRDLHAQIEQVVADGPQKFDAGDITALAGGVARVVELLTEQPCDGFLEP